MGSVHSSQDYDSLAIFGGGKTLASLSAGVMNLSELEDVELTDPLEDGQILKYIASTGKWTNVDPQLLTNTFVEGYVSRSGTGYTTTFLLPHGLGSTPTHVIVDPQSPEANDDFTMTTDNVNIYLEYAFPPPQTGINNLLFYYRVS